MKDCLSQGVNRKRAMALQAAGGYLQTAILTVQGFVLVPLYLHFIGPHTYGLWLSSGGILAMLGVLQSGIGNLLIQRVAQAYGQQDLGKAGAYFINGLLVYLIVSFISVAVGMLLSLGLVQFLKSPDGSGPQLTHCFQLAVLATGVGLCNECLRGFAQALLRPLFQSLALALFRMLGIAATVMLLYRGAGLWAIPAAMLLTEALALVSGTVQAVGLFRGLQSKVLLDRRIVKEYFQVGGALFVAKLGNVFSKESDPLLITLFLRPEVTTAYMVTRRAADILFRLLSVINASAYGGFSHLAGEGNAARIRDVADKLQTTVFSLGLVGFAAYVGVNRSFISLWVGKSFALEQSVVFFIGVGFFSSAVRNSTLQLLNGLGDFNYTSSVVFMEGLGKAVLAALLLKAFGVVGVPLSLIVASSAAMMVMRTRLNQITRCLSSHHHLWRSLTVMALLFALTQCFARLQEPAGSWLTFMAVTAELVAAGSMVCVMANWSRVRQFNKTLAVRR